MNLDSSVDRYEKVLGIDMKKNSKICAVHSLNADATTCIALFLARMAALQLIAIAHYYSSLRLAIPSKKRTLHAVQLMSLG